MALPQKSFGDASKKKHEYDIFMLGLCEKAKDCKGEDCAVQASSREAKRRSIG